VKKRVIVIPLLVIIVAVVAIGGYLFSRKDPRPIVVLDSVSTAHLTKEVIATGEIASAHSTTAAAAVAGRIASLSVAEGDAVFRGSPIARLEDESLSLREQSAHYTLEAAERGVRQELMALRTAFDDATAVLDRTTRTYERTEELSEIGSASMDDLRTAEENLTAARRSYDNARERLNYREDRALDDPRESPSQPDDEIIAGSIEVKQAQAGLEGFTRELADHVVTARARGTVTELYVDEGDFVGAGSPVARVDDWNALEVTSAVDEVDLGYVELGQEVRIDSDSFISTTLDGTVADIAQVIRREGDKRICDITVGFQDPDGLARIGASCTIYITVRDLLEAASIPIESYFIEDGKRYVYVPVPKAVTPDEAESQQKPRFLGGSATANMVAYVLEKREVRIGIIGLGRAEVTGGLELGESIVASGVRELSDGLEVLVPAEPQPDESQMDESQPDDMPMDTDDQTS
jgi:HlyD family secretion protein